LIELIKNWRNIMAVRESSLVQTIDLSTEHGNVFGLIGIATRLARQLELDGKAISKEMMSGDYGNAVYVFNRDFGQFFDIVLPKGMTAESLEASYNRTNMTEEKMKKIYLK
jgi:hypothetical protein